MYVTDKHSAKRRLLWISSMYAVTYLNKLSEVFKTKLKRIKLNTDGIQVIAKGTLVMAVISTYVRCLYLEFYGTT